MASIAKSSTPSFREPELTLEGNQALSYLHNWKSIFEATEGKLLIERDGTEAHIQVFKGNRKFLDVCITRIWIHHTYQFSREYCHVGDGWESTFIYRAVIEVQNKSKEIFFHVFMLLSHRFDGDSIVHSLTVDFI